MDSAPISDPSSPDAPADPQWMSSLPKQPRGKFKIATEFLREYWRALLPIFARVAIIRAEALFLPPVIEYEALCEDFEVIDPWIAAPSYQPRFLRHPDGTVTFEGFQRITA